ncbi:cobalamin-binding protein [Halorussus halobius]|uniref:cobalamin-binding protein n=1 Tax=Halorussus halobius TaxID=1710537 RepID=UPI001091F1CE|nr:cobalamin-binding protein [Halorussus halobius]
MRVVSLLPSATEIGYALGIEPVGVSHECDYPPRAAELPAANRSLVDPTASTAEINEQVEAAMDDHDGVYDVRRDVLRELDPDLILTQGICDVCAVDSVLVEDALAELDLDARVLTTDPHSLEDVFEDVRLIGEATGRTERAESLVADLRERVRAVERAVPSRAATPRVAVLDWMQPPMTSGHWIPGMVERAGGAYGLAEPRVPSRPIAWEDVLEYDPEVLVVAPCGFDLDTTHDRLDELTGRDGWQDLSAVQSGRVYAIDGNHYVNRPGPRLVDTLEYFAAILHPETFESPPSDAVERLATKPASPSGR